MGPEVPSHGLDPPVQLPEALARRITTLERRELWKIEHDLPVTLLSHAADLLALAG